MKQCLQPVSYKFLTVITSNTISNIGYSTGFTLTIFNSTEGISCLGDCILS